MYPNYYAIEIMAREIQNERNLDANKRRRLSQARQALKRLTRTR